MSRETRLLLVTITISALVLLLLSRLRFPRSDATVESPPAPLERLAASASYTELAAIVAGLERRIAPSLVVLRVASRADVPPRTLTDVLNPGGTDQIFRHVPALRLSENTALAALAGEERFVQINGEPAEILARDPLRNLSLLRVPPAASETLPQLRLKEMSTPSYVVVVEGTRAGLTFRPVFVGAKDRFEDARWSRPLLAVSSTAVTSAGALVFSLERHFLGCSFVEAGALAIAPAAEIMEAAVRLSKGPPPKPADIGVSVQPLSTAMSNALGVKAGLVVADVVHRGPAGESLEFGDVITHSDDQPVGNAADFLVRLAQRAPGSSIKLAVVRKRAEIVVSITVPTHSPEIREFAGGLELRTVRAMGSMVTALVDGSQADEAGLRPGDLIVQAGETQVPRPAQVYSLLRATAPDRYLLLKVDRNGRIRLVVFPGLGANSDPR